MHASLNVGYQGKSGPGKIHKVILVDKNGTVVPEKQLSLQSKYSFPSLFVIKYANIFNGIFSV